MKILIPIFALLIGLITANPAALAANGVCPPGSTVVGTAATLAAALAVGGDICVNANIAGAGGIAATQPIAVPGTTLEGITPSTTIGLSAAIAGAMFAIAAAANNVTIKDITLDGSTGFLAGSGVTNAGNGTTIQNVTFVDPAGGGFAAAAGGAILVTASNDTIANNKITTSGNGIAVTGGNNVIIQTNNITLQGAGAAFSAIAVGAGSGHKVLTNTIFVTTAKTGFAGAAGACSVAAAITGIICNSVAGMPITGNSITFVGVAVAAAAIWNAGANGTVNSNTFTGFAGSGFGINSLGANTTIDSNTLNGAGPWTGGINIIAANNVVTNNNVSGGAALPSACVILGVGSANTQVNKNNLTACGGAGVLVFTTNNTIGTSGAGNVITAPFAAGPVFGLGILILTSASNNDAGFNQITGATGAGIVLFGSGNNKLHDNTISGSSSGSAATLFGPLTEGGIVIVSAAGPVPSSNNIIDKNTVTGGSSNGIVDSFFAAACPGPSIGNQITNNTVTGNAGTGIFMGNCSTAVAGPTNTVITGNTVGDSGSTVSGTFGENIVIQGLANNSTVNNNTVTSNKGLTNENRGIRISNSTIVSVQGNTIHNTGTLDVGLILDVATSNVTAKGNVITGMKKIGIRNLGGSATLGADVLDGNILAGDVTGVSLEGGVANLVNCNTISGGATSLAVSSGVNATHFHFNGNSAQSPILINNSGVGSFDAKGNFFNPAPSNGATVFGTVDTSNPLSAACTNSSAPGISINPTGGTQGASNVSFTITGQNLPAFAANSTVSFTAGQGATGTVTVQGTPNVNGNTITGTVNISANALGAFTVSVSNVQPTTTFTVTAALVQSIALNPNTGQAGAPQFTLTINGTNTSFAAGATVSFAPPDGITLGTVTVVSPTQITVPVTIAANAALGNSSVSVSGSTAAPATFTVTAPPFPAALDITSITERCSSRGAATKALRVKNNTGGDVIINSIGKAGANWGTFKLTSPSPSKLPLTLKNKRTLTIRATGTCTGTGHDLALKITLNNGASATKSLGERPEQTTLDVGLQGGWLVVQAASASDVQQLSAQVFNLNGQLLTEVQAYGNRLAALAHDGMNRPLANGVYFVLIKVQQADGTVYTEVKKIAVLR
jgi:parallel beta-helix repeat protein